MNKFKENLKKIWSKITESKLNISMFVAGVIAFILLAVILGIIIHRDGQVNNELIVTGEKNDTNTTKAALETTETEKETTTKSEEQYSTKIDENATTNIVSKASRLSAKVSVKNSWTNDGEYFIQYSIDVTNISDTAVDGWAIVLDMAKSYTLVDSWNYTFKDGSRKLIINPFNDNKKVPAGETVSGGFIVKGTSNVYVDYITVYVGNKIETIKNGNTYIPSGTTVKPTKNDSNTTVQKDDTTTVKKQPLTNEESTTVDNSEDDTTTPEAPPEDNSDDSISISDSTEIVTPENTTTPEISSSSKTEIITPESNTTTPEAQ